MKHLDSNSVLLTGANSGIGLECAKALCAVGSKCDLTITVRDDEKGKDTVELLRSINPECLVAYYVMDLADHSSIRSFAKEFLATGKRLDILINNAGLATNFPAAKRLSLPDNPRMEITMAVNCIGPFLLTSLLVDLLKESAKKRGDGNPSQVVNITSRITTQTFASKCKFYFDDIMLDQPGHYIDGRQAYTCSKIGVNLWTQEMAMRLNQKEVTVNALCPGFIPGTSIGRNSSKFMQFVFSVMHRMSALVGFITTPSDGKDEILRHTFEEFQRCSGRIYIDGKVSDRLVRMGLENQKRMWALCEKYTGLHDKHTSLNAE